MMAFPNFHEKKSENTSYFLDDLEMAFLVSGRDEEEVKLRDFSLVMRDEAKIWFQGLTDEEKTDWDTLKETFLAKYETDNMPEKRWKKLTYLQQDNLESYSAYEAQFLKLWAQWEASLEEGERASNFLQKKRILAGLSPILQEKVRGKFSETFDEAKRLAKAKDQKLQFQANLGRREPQALFDESQPQQPPHRHPSLFPLPPMIHIWSFSTG